jgi:hypothetical protein
MTIKECVCVCVGGGGKKNVKEKKKEKKIFVCFFFLWNLKRNGKAVGRKKGTTKRKSAGSRLYTKK